MYFILYAIAGLHALSIFSVLKTLHADFHGSWTSLHPHQYPRVSGPMALELQAAESECWETNSGPLKHTLSLRAILPTPKKFAFLKWIAMQTFFLRRLCEFIYQLCCWTSFYRILAVSRYSSDFFLF